MQILFLYLALILGTLVGLFYEYFPYVFMGIFIILYLFDKKVRGE